MIKDRNGKGLPEVEKSKKRWQDYIEEWYKKGVSDPDNDYGVVTCREPDILEWEITWVLGSITMNKASRGDWIQTELFQILKDDAVKVLTQNVSKFGKCSSGHRMGKCEFSFQSQRKAMPKNIETTGQSHSFLMLAR